MNKMKRFLALSLIVILILLYLSTLIIAFLDIPYKESIIQACIFSSVVIPVFLWAYLLVYRLLKNKNTIEDADDISSTPDDPSSHE